MGIDRPSGVCSVRMRERIRGFYSILDRHDESLARVLVRPVEQGGCGASVLQVRMKEAKAAEVIAAARMARAVCNEYGALCIVNDRIDIALAVGADGVHLGQNDMPIDKARASLERLSVTRPFLIGISTHSRRQINDAVMNNADYVGYGPVFKTKTKANPDPERGLAKLRAAVASACGLPVVAIGGITPEHAPDIAKTGAAAACSIAGVNGAEDTAAAGAAVTRAFLDFAGI